MALVVPVGLLLKLQPTLQLSAEGQDGENPRKIELLAMQLVMDTEKRLGFNPRDVSVDRCGYDIESRIPGSGRLRFIEVKGRAAGAATVTITRNEILTGLNSRTISFSQSHRSRRPEGSSLYSEAVPARPRLWRGEREL